MAASMCPCQPTRPFQLHAIAFGWPWICRVRSAASAASLPRGALPELAAADGAVRCFGLAMRTRPCTMSGL